MKAELEDVFGEVAVALAPRAKRSAPRIGRERAEVSFRLATKESLLAFGELLSPKMLSGLTDVSTNDEVRYELAVDAAKLRVLAADKPALRALLAAWDNVHEPPRPPRIMGVINVTPDSFSDGGQFLDPARAVEHGLALVAEGANLLDVGGESTRPGSEPVPVDEELRRVVPVIERLARETTVPISVDTSKAAVAERALDAGARIVNDVTAGRFDAEMIPLVARRGCEYVLMHMQGTPRDMQRDPHYRDVVGDVCDFLRERAATCWRAGIDPVRLHVDPGLGFGKTLEHNLALLRHLDQLRSLGLSIAIGPSRKSFIQRLNERSGATRASDRIGGTAAAVAECVRGGAEILRVHDVAIMAEAARVAWSVRRAGELEHDPESD